MYYVTVVVYYECLPSTRDLHVGVCHNMLEISLYPHYKKFQIYNVYNYLSFFYLINITCIFGMFPRLYTMQQETRTINDDLMGFPISRYIKQQLQSLHLHI